MAETLEIKGITAIDLPQIFAWYRSGQGTFFLVDPHNKFLFITFEDVLKYFEQKLFIYEFIVSGGCQTAARPIGLARMIPEAGNHTLVFDLWLENFSATNLEGIISLLKNYWMGDRLFHKLETRIIFEKEYRPVYSSAGFKTDSLMRNEVFFDGGYFHLETLAYIAGHA